jgi:uncharacterized membrane protein (UPF0127 family)
VVRRSVALLVLAFATAACSQACTKASTPEPPPTPVTPDPSDAPPPPPDTRPRVILEGSGPAAEVRVEIVATDAAIMKGLMYRQYLPPDDGMLFLMGAEDDWGFWMKNTLIPLDIIFITRDLEVAGVLFDMKPLDKTSKHVGAPSLYVLEVNGGWAKAHGIDKGAKATFDGVQRTDR